jgi:hypothetical protein
MLGIGQRSGLPGAADQHDLGAVAMLVALGQHDSVGQAGVVVASTWPPHGMAQQLNAGSLKAGSRSMRWTSSQAAWAPSPTQDAAGPAVRFHYHLHRAVLLLSTVRRWSGRRARPRSAPARARLGQAWIAVQAPPPILVCLGQTQQLLAGLGRWRSRGGLPRLVGRPISTPLSNLTPARTAP